MRNELIFRKDQSPDELKNRLLVCIFFLALFYFIPSKSPKERIDRQWLLTFFIIMMIYFIFLFGVAYIPTALFGNFPNCLESALNIRPRQ